VAFKLQTAVFTSEAGATTFSEVGTFAKHAKGMTVKFSKKNLASTKKVTLLLTDKKGDIFRLSCTSPLSEIVRKALAKGKEHKEILSALLPLTIIVDDENPEKYFLSAPGDGTGLPAFSVSDLDEEADFDEILGGY
jgi:hypothetical protein